MVNELLADPNEANEELDSSTSSSVAAYEAGPWRSGDGRLTAEEKNLILFYSASSLIRDDQNAGEDGLAPQEGKFSDGGGRHAALYTKWIYTLPLLLVGLAVLMASKKANRMLMNRMIRSSAADWVIPLSAPSMPKVTMRELVLCECQLRSNASEFQNLWQAASPVVQAAFTKYFVPSTEYDRAAVLDPLKLYNKHINAMLGAPRPLAKDVRALQEHKLNLILLNGVCSAASMTLRKLAELEELHADTGVPVPVLGLGKPMDVLLLERIMERKKRGKTAAELLRKFGIVVKPERETMSGRDLLLKYADDLMRENQVLKSRISSVKIEFIPFFRFQGLGGAIYPGRDYPKLRIVYSGEQFGVRHFAFDTEIYTRLPVGEPKVPMFLAETGAEMSNRALADFVLDLQEFQSTLARSELNSRRRYFDELGFAEGGLDPESLEALARFVI
ncbi:uncharacterized protein EMH_0032300 [Eimeria mitis]|uniref:Uncharacterized protein n=1 Tax=Eimeria mitis TaxID=44415 RepID=U6JPV8_9EIME|nr:uncharacterized protein EMH_0032300 [Eimeria mitis]CDJ27499.1 hypothetical protein EMH_0032300 [Eimeria mitis]